MHDVMPDSELVEFDDATHCLPLEEPEPVADLIDTFVRRVGATQPQVPPRPARSKLGRWALTPLAHEH